MTAPRVLFLGGPSPDYVADSLFHGLRTRLGDRVVDWPKRAPMYAGADPAYIYGRGFGCYGLLPDIPVDREAVFERDWDLVVSAVIWRDWGCWSRAWRAYGSRVRHAVIDGGDLPWVYPYGPTWWRPSRWFVPRAHTRAMYFKREWGRITMVAACRKVPLEPIAIAYPVDKIVSTPQTKTQDFATHVVDLEVGERLGRKLEHDRVHIFQHEAEYLADLRASRFGVTTKRAGWDALRHLEIAGAGAIPCFRDLNRKPETCAPHGLIDGRNCLSYRNADDLMRRVGQLSDDGRACLADAAVAWARANSTEQRALSFLDRAL